MATRQEIQAALDLIRFTNIANDLFDVSAKMAAPQTATLGNQKTTGVIAVGSAPTPVIDDASAAQIKQNISRSMDNIQGYISQINSYLSDPDKLAMVTNGLNALSVSIDDIQSDVAGFQDTANAVTTALANNNASLDDVASSISGSVTPLNLVRNG